MFGLTGTPFQRIWCCFERAMIIHKEQGHNNDDDNSRLLLDIVTVVEDGTAVVITDGRAPHVVADLREGPKFALELKRDRELGFPLELLERAYEIDICAATAAREEDRRRILNTIQRTASSKSLSTMDSSDDNDHTATTQPKGSNEEDDELPNLKDPAFSRVNKVLRGIFAEAAARKAAEAGRIDTVIRVLQEDTERIQLTLNLGGCAHLDLTGLSNLAGHASLQQLTVDCSYSGVTNVTSLADTLSSMPSLRKLHFSFEWCTSTLEEREIVQLSDRGLASLSATLVRLRLDFTGCAFAVFLPKIEKLQYLESLVISYCYTPTAAIAKTLLGILQLRKLRELELNFRACQH
eukprot:Sro1556_g282190.1 n/a (350) ;mRNA; r:125-1176